MDFLRLPPPIRRVLLSHVHPRRLLTTDPTNSAGHSNDLPPSSQALLTLSTETLNSYTTSLAPNANQLRYASSTFQHPPPHLLWSAATFRSFPPSPHPEVAFLGRSNVGKSSLLNALFGRTRDQLVHVSKQPGKTRTMNGFGLGAPMGAAPLKGEKEAAWKRLGRGGLVVVDMPGYGGGSREEWGKEALKYLLQRKQLRKTFLLVDAEHGLKSTDVELLRHFRREGIAHTIVLSKVDKILYPGAKPPGAIKLSNALLKLQQRCEDVRRELKEIFDDGREMRDDILCCSADKSLDERSGWRSKIGVDELRWAVLSSCGLESDEQGMPKGKRAIKTAKAEEPVVMRDAFGEYTLPPARPSKRSYSSQ